MPLPPEPEPEPEPEGVGEMVVDLNVDWSPYGRALAPKYPYGGQTPRLQDITFDEALEYFDNIPLVVKPSSSYGQENWSGLGDGVIMTWDAKRNVAPSPWK